MRLLRQHSVLQTQAETNWLAKAKKKKKYTFTEPIRMFYEHFLKMHKIQPGLRNLAENKRRRVCKFSCVPVFNEPGSVSIGAKLKPPWNNYLL